MNEGQEIEGDLRREERGHKMDIWACRRMRGGEKCARMTSITEGPLELRGHTFQVRFISSVCVQLCLCRYGVGAELYLTSLVCFRHVRL